MKMVKQSIKILKSMRYKNGLFAAASKEVSTGYNMAWIRDNIYSILGFEATNNKKEVIKTLRTLLDIMLKHEYKLDWMIKQPLPKARYRYIHARFDPKTGEELAQEWGNKQNDSIGSLLFKIGELERKGIKVHRNKSDLRILQKLVNYLEAIEYWKDEDNGIWEENEEVHASSVGACVAGLREISFLVEVTPELILKGMHTLAKLLPRESITKETDLALLSLIYPFKVTTKEQTNKILKAIETKLVKEKGIIRYKDDNYYSNGSEAEWCFGFPWLAIIFKELNQADKYAHYMRKSLSAMNKKGEMPELYYANTSTHNENTPLAWAQSLYVVAKQLEATL